VLFGSIISLPFIDPSHKWDGNELNRCVPSIISLPLVSTNGWKAVSLKDI
jgi:hypothetical protein